MPGPKNPDNQTQPDSEVTDPKVHAAEEAFLPDLDEDTPTDQAPLPSEPTEEAPRPDEEELTDRTNPGLEAARARVQATSQTELVEDPFDLGPPRVISSTPDRSSRFEEESWDEPSWRPPAEEEEKNDDEIDWGVDQLDDPNYIRVPTFDERADAGDRNPYIFEYEDFLRQNYTQISVDDVIWWLTQKKISGNRQEAAENILASFERRGLIGEKTLSGKHEVLSPISPVPQIPPEPVRLVDLEPPYTPPEKRAPQQQTTGSGGIGGILKKLWPFGKKKKEPVNDLPPYEEVFGPSHEPHTGPGYYDPPPLPESYDEYDEPDSGPQELFGRDREPLPPFELEVRRADIQYEQLVQSVQNDSFIETYGARVDLKETAIFRRGNIILERHERNEGGVRSVEYSLYAQYREKTGKRHRFDHVLIIDEHGATNDRAVLLDTVTKRTRNIGGRYKLESLVLDLQDWVEDLTKEAEDLAGETETATPSLVEAAERIIPRYGNELSLGRESLPLTADRVFSQGEFTRDIYKPGEAFTNAWVIAIPYSFTHLATGQTWGGRVAISVPTDGSPAQIQLARLDQAGAFVDSHLFSGNSRITTDTSSEEILKLAIQAARSQILDLRKDVNKETKDLPPTVREVMKLYEDPIAWARTKGLTIDLSRLENGKTGQLAIQPRAATEWQTKEDEWELRGFFSYGAGQYDPDEIKKDFSIIINLDDPQHPIKLITDKESGEIASQCSLLEGMEALAKINTEIRSAAKKPELVSNIIETIPEAGTPPYMQETAYASEGTYEKVIGPPDMAYRRWDIGIAASVLNKQTKDSYKIFTKAIVSLDSTEVIRLVTATSMNDKSADDVDIGTYPPNTPAATIVAHLERAAEAAYTALISSFENPDTGAPTEPDDEPTGPIGQTTKKEDEPVTAVEKKVRLGNGKELYVGRRYEYFTQSQAQAYSADVPGTTVVILPNSTNDELHFKDVNSETSYILTKTEIANINKKQWKRRFREIT